jgi:hypothetical protein
MPDDLRFSFSDRSAFRLQPFALRCLYHGGTELLGWSHASAVRQRVDPAVLVPPELVRDRRPCRRALDVVLRVHPPVRCDVKRILAIQDVIVASVPVALRLRRGRRRAAPLVEPERRGALVSKVLEWADDGLGNIGQP